MKTSWTTKEKSQGELVVTIDGQVWADAQAKAFEKKASELQVDGFRKGHVPAKVAKTKINPASVLMEAVDNVANEALSKGVQEHNIEMVARPELRVEKIDEAAVELKFIVTVKPEVTLGEYKGLKVTLEKVKVEEAEVEAELAKTQEKLAQLVLKEGGALENGETAVIDFEGFLDGEPFEGGKGENFELVIGSGQFIPGFEEQLIGMKSGDEQEIKVTFPDSYPAENLSGKETTFKVKLHDIKSKELPAIDDELAKEANVEGVETLEALKKHLLETLTKSKELEAKEKFLDTLYTKVVENATVELPDAMIEEEVNQIFQDFQQRLSQQGLDMEGYLGFMQKTEEEVRAEMRPEGERRLKFRLVIETVATVEAIEVTDEEVDAEITKIAETYQMEVDVIKSMLGDLSGIKNELKARKALQLIEDSAK